MLRKQIVVGDQERILLIKNGRFGGILSPGRYLLLVPPGVVVETEAHDIRNVAFDSAWADYLIKERPAVAERHFTRVETNDFQVAMVYVDTKLFTVLTPAKRVLFWNGPGAVTAEVVDVIAKPNIPASRVPGLERMGRAPPATFTCA